MVGAQLRDACVRDLPSFLRSGDIMVFNDTRVIPARLLGKRGEAKVEVLLHRRNGSNCLCFAKPAKRLRLGDRIDFSEDFFAIVEEKRKDGQVLLHFDEKDFDKKLVRYGLMPLPPYIEKKRSVIARSEVTKQSKAGSPRAFGARDDDDYQTIYAKHEGSVAAPTAGLHFTESLLQAVDAVGVKRVYVTLHVGGGTFLPVKVENTKDHVMHSEYAEISTETAVAINETKAKGGRVIAVGTTSLRTLESTADENGMIRSFSGETDIFITPGYRFKCADMLLTNFHLPRSTLFMLVCAFAGMDHMKEAYAHAITQQYRFYSYGDACLLCRA